MLVAMPRYVHCRVDGSHSSNIGGFLIGETMMASTTRLVIELAARLLEVQVAPQPWEENGCTASRARRANVGMSGQCRPDATLGSDDGCRQYRSEMYR